MQVKIGFTNPNVNATGIRVYRALTPIDITNLPAPIDTIAPDATSYTDTTVLKDQTYYYIFEVFKGTDVVRTANIKATVTFYTGPGNQTLKGGDLSAGYYGIVQSSDLIDWDTLVTLCGVTLSTKNAAATQDWLKFIYKGKVLFIPKQPIGTLAWNTLYGKGLVYGTNDNGPRDYNTAAATNQQKLLTIAGLQFKVRLMRGLPTNANLASAYLAANNTGSTGGYTSNSASPDSYDSLYDLSGSEWNDLFMRVMSHTPPSQKGRNWDHLNELLSNTASTAYTGMNQDALFMEMVSTTNIISRGKNNSNASYHPGYAAATITPSQVMWWRPVLEMI